MARTPAFASLMRAFRMADRARELGWGEQRLREEIDRARSRRDFLKLSAGAAISPLMMKVAKKSGNKPITMAPGDQILILGAGAAGLAAAYTLKKSSIPYQVLEGSSSVGGRIKTAYNFNSDKMFVELGAELVDTNHHALIDLAHEMGLEIETFPADPAGVDRQLHFIGGQIYTIEELVAALPPMMMAITTAMATKASQAAWDQKSVAEFLDTLNGKVESWALKAIAVAYASENGRPITEQSALNLIGVLDPAQTTVAEFEMFGTSDESKRIKGGNSQLPMKLAEAIDQKNTVVFRSNILAIQDTGPQIVVTTSEDGKIVEHQGVAVICTLPFNILRNVEGIDTLGIDPTMLECIQTMGYGQNSKLFMDFTARPWLQKNGTTPAYSGLSYDDYGTQNFWETSRLQNGTHGILTNFVGSDVGLNASMKTLDDLTLPNLQRMVPGLPSLYVKGRVQNWNQIPFHYASYSCWLPNQQLRFNSSLRKAQLKGRLVFAGEHISIDYQGYMNGAYKTGTQAANQIISELSGKKKQVS